MLKKGGLTALLLFGMFFGAGNLTFSPSARLSNLEIIFGLRLQGLSYQV